MFCCHVAAHDLGAGFGGHRRAQLGECAAQVGERTKRLRAREVFASVGVSRLRVAVGGPSGANGLDEVDRMHRLTVELGVADRVRWCDPQPHHILSTYYRASDVCLVPSRSESFGLVALEAAACGIPVIAANVGGLQTLVDHGETGALLNERDPQLWAATIDRILDSPTLAASMGQRAAARSLRYAWSYTGARLRRLYSDLNVRQLVDCK